MFYLLIEWVSRAVSPSVGDSLRSSCRLLPLLCVFPVFSLGFVSSQERTSVKFWDLGVCPSLHTNHRHPPSNCHIPPPPTCPGGRSCPSPVPCDLRGFPRGALGVLNCRTPSWKQNAPAPAYFVGPVEGWAIGNLTAGNAY